VKNIREYEETHLKQVEEAMQEKRDLGIKVRGLCTKSLGCQELLGSVCLSPPPRMWLAPAFSDSDWCLSGQRGSNTLCGRVISGPFYITDCGETAGQHCRVSESHAAQQGRCWFQERPYLP